MRTPHLFNTLKSVCALLILGLALLVPAFGGPYNTTVMIDGRVTNLSQPPIIMNDRVMVPLRGVFQNLGAYVTYLPATQSVVVSKMGERITLGMNSSEAMIDGKPQLLDSPPVLVNGNIMVPLRFVSQALGADVRWLADNRTVSISSGTGTPLTPVSNAPLIQTIATNPATAHIGQEVSVTMIGTPGGTASMRIGGGEKLLMDETSPGMYVGSYRAPARQAGAFQDVAVHLMMPDGRETTRISNLALFIKAPHKLIHHKVLGSGAILPLQIGGPNPAAKVGQVFDVWGTTAPNAVVRVRILAEKSWLGFFFGSRWDQVVSTQTVADANGEYHLRVNTGPLAAGVPLKMSVTAANRYGAFSKEIRMDLTRVA